MFGQENNEFQEDPFALNSLSKKQEDEGFKQNKNKS